MERYQKRSLQSFISLYKGRRIHCNNSRCLRYVTPTLKSSNQATHPDITQIYLPTLTFKEPRIQSFGYTILKENCFSALRTDFFCSPQALRPIQSASPCGILSTRGRGLLIDYQNVLFPSQFFQCWQEILFGIDAVAGKHSPLDFLNYRPVILYMILFLQTGI